MDTVTQTPTTDDQELAKVLESMNASAKGGVPAADVAAAPTDDGDTTAAPVTPVENDLTFDASPVAPLSTLPDPVAVAPSVASEPVAPLADYIPTGATTTAGDSDLESIKKDALTELRPLVDKLELPPDEKFDTLLLIIRSTDDRTLVSAAHEAAKAIEDDAKRAEALLDVIKEIDYFANPQR